VRPQGSVGLPFKDGYGAVQPGREDTEDDPLIREAVERCPSQAISLSFGGTE